MTKAGAKHANKKLRAPKRCGAGVERQPYMGLEQAVKALAFAAAACDAAPPPSRRQLKLAAPSALKKNSAAGAPVMDGGPARMTAWRPATSTWTCALAQAGLEFGW